MIQAPRMTIEQTKELNYFASLLKTDPDNLYDKLITWNLHWLRESIPSTEFSCGSVNLLYDPSDLLEVSIKLKLFDQPGVSISK